MMGRGRRLTALMTGLVLLALCLGACGGDDDSTSPPPGYLALPEAARSAASRDSGGGSAQFLVKNGNNRIQEFGREASDSERKYAAAVLHAFLDARAREDWASVCSYYSRAMRVHFRELASYTPELKGKNCTKTLAGLERATAQTRKEAAEVDVGSLRVAGNEGFILYHGAFETDYMLEMLKEGGAWKVHTLRRIPIE